MPMRDVTVHGMETDRARRGLLMLTLHADLKALCRMQRLRDEAAAGGLAVQVRLSDLVGPEEASKWIKSTERKCLEQRDRAD